MISFRAFLLEHPQRFPAEKILYAMRNLLICILHQISHHNVEHFRRIWCP
jgi:hypothetical protein